MKLKLFIIILVIGTFIGVNYAEAQKSDLNNIIENNNDVVDTNQDEEVSNTTISNTDITTVVDSNQTQTESQVQNGKIINGVSLIQQLPELPRGCEVTSLAMLLQYAGVSVDKMTLANEINTISYKDQNGLNGNPNVGFVGDLYSFDNSGYGVYHTPIAQLAETYLPGRIVDLTGSSIESVYNMIDNGSPVWVITNSRFSALPESEFITWNTASGEIQVTYREHSVLVVGYDENYVYLNDPLKDEAYTSVSRDIFEESWIQMGSQAVSYQ